MTSKEQLKETMEEHEANVHAIDHLTEVSIRDLYVSLVNEVSKILEDDEDE